jgi:hypothetical protein
MVRFPEKAKGVPASGRSTWQISDPADPTAWERGPIRGIAKKGIPEANPASGIPSPIYHGKCNGGVSRSFEEKSPGTSHGRHRGHSDDYEREDEYEYEHEYDYD